MWRELSELSRNLKLVTPQGLVVKSVSKGVRLIVMIVLLFVEWLAVVSGFFNSQLDQTIGSGYYFPVGKSKTESGIYASTFQINNGKLAQSMRMSLPAALVRTLGLMKGMTAYIKVHTDGTFTVYPNKPPSDTRRQRR
jgi:hypothetical protein